MRVRRSPSGLVEEESRHALLMGGREAGAVSSFSDTKIYVGSGGGSRVQTHTKLFFIVTMVLLTLLLWSFISLQLQLRELEAANGPYDPRPLGVPQVRSDGSIVYDIAVVTDLDHESRDRTDKKGKWISWMKRGRLTLSADFSSASVEWADGKETRLESNVAAGGRAMELSDLCVFNHRLLTVDDRTGIIYEISDGDVIPWVLLNDGPGNVTKGFKGEWMTVKDDALWVGGLGKEWTNEKGAFINEHPMWVKRVDRAGRVTHLDWSDVYKQVRGAAGISFPGYMVHEAVQWSDVHGKWFFLPRRASTETYDEALDEKRGTNMLISYDGKFEGRPSLLRIGRSEPGLRGYSAFQFIPSTHDELIVALKSEEKDGKPLASHITVFDIHGNVIMPDQTLKGEFKFEGLAFV